MIAEKVRSDSLVPGSSVLPLIRTQYLPGCPEPRLFPIVSADGIGLGCVDERFVALFRGSKYFSYTKLDKVKVLRVKGKDLKEAFKLFAQDLHRRGLLPADMLDDPIVCLAKDKSVFHVERSLAPLMGARKSRLIVFGFAGRDRSCQLWMGRRTATAVREPTRLQNIISIDLNERLIMDREALSKVAYEAVGLQPALYRSLRSAGIQTSTIRIPKGVSRVTTQCYELDLTDFPGFTPTASPSLPVEGFELVPVKTVLDWCHAKVICEDDVVPIIAFAIRHGIITPETDEHYVQVCEAIQGEALQLPGAL